MQGVLASSTNMVRPPGMLGACMHGKTARPRNGQLTWVHVGGADLWAPQLGCNHLLQPWVAGGVVVAVPRLQRVPALLDLWICCLGTLPHGPHHRQRRAAVVVAGPPLAAAARTPAEAAAQAARKCVRGRQAQPRRWGGREHMHQTCGCLQRPHEFQGWSLYARDALHRLNSALAPGCRAAACCRRRPAGSRCWARSADRGEGTAIFNVHYLAICIATMQWKKPKVQAITLKQARQLARPLLRRRPAEVP